MKTDIEAMKEIRSLIEQINRVVLPFKIKVKWTRDKEYYVYLTNVDIKREWTRNDPMETRPSIVASDLMYCKTIQEIDAFLEGVIKIVNRMEIQLEKIGIQFPLYFL